MVTPPPNQGEFEMRIIDEAKLEAVVEPVGNSWNARNMAEVDAMKIRDAVILLERTGVISAASDTDPDRCPFCGRDPFHRVDNGLGMEAVAVTCCDLGNEFFLGARPAPETVTISWDDFREIGKRLVSRSCASVDIVKISIPTETMEQEFAAHFRRGVFAGQNGKPSAIAPAQAAPWEPALRRILDDISTEDGKCSWAEVANILPRMRGELRDEPQAAAVTGAGSSIQELLRRAETYLNINAADGRGSGLLVMELADALRALSRPDREVEQKLTGKYQPRTPERLAEILRSQDQNPRSWQREAADEIERSARRSSGHKFDPRANPDPISG
jgi:hypothetical protein